MSHPPRTDIPLHYCSTMLLPPRPLSSTHAAINKREKEKKKKETANGSPKSGFKLSRFFGIVVVFGLHSRNCEYSIPGSLSTARFCFSVSMAALALSVFKSFHLFFFFILLLLFFFHGVFFRDAFWLWVMAKTESLLLFFFWLSEGEDEEGADGRHQVTGGNWGLWWGRVNTSVHTFLDTNSVELTFLDPAGSSVPIWHELTVS